MEKAEILEKLEEIKVSGKVWYPEQYAKVFYDTSGKYPIWKLENGTNNKLHTEIIELVADEIISISESVFRLEEMKQEMEERLNSMSEEEFIQSLEESGFVVRKEGEIIEKGSLTIGDKTLSVSFDTVDQTFSLSLSDWHDSVAVDTSEEDLKKVITLLSDSLN